MKTLQLFGFAVLSLLVFGCGEGETGSQNPVQNTPVPKPNFRMDPELLGSWYKMINLQEYYRVISRDYSMSMTKKGKEESKFEYDISYKVTANDIKADPRRAQFSLTKVNSSKEPPAKLASVFSCIYQVFGDEPHRTLKIFCNSGNSYAKDFPDMQTEYYLSKRKD